MQAQVAGDETMLLAVSQTGKRGHDVASRGLRRRDVGGADPFEEIEDEGVDDVGHDGLSQ